MRNHLRFCLLILAIIASTCSGCTHTRYAESSHNWKLGGGGGGCTCGADHH